MAKEELWARAVVAGWAPEAADSIVSAYEERFPRRESDGFSLDNPPSWEDLVEETTLEGARVRAEYNSALKQWLLRFSKNGLSGTIYTNQKEEANAKWAYQDQGLDWLQEGIIQVDEDISHEDG